MQNDSISEEPDNAALAWGIKITLRVLLSENDVSSLESPLPLYFQVPSSGYLYSVLPKIKPLWQHVLPPALNGTHIPWFSYNSLPLKWNVPTDVLYDLLVPNHGSHPWQITLHYTGFPSTTLGDYTGEDSLKSTFRNALKEASFIATNKSSQSVMDMVIPAREDHWKTLGNGGVRGGSKRNYTKYREIMNSIPLISPESLEAVPLRVYLRPGINKNTGNYLSSYEVISQTSRPAPVLTADGQQLKTLGAALLPIIKSWLIEHGGKWQIKSESGAETVSGDEEKKEIETAWSQVDAALSGGIELHPNLILRDLHRDLHSPDFFLYVVLHMR